MSIWKVIKVAATARRRAHTRRIRAAMTPHPFNATSTARSIADGDPLPKKLKRAERAALQSAIEAEQTHIRSIYPYITSGRVKGFALERAARLRTASEAVRAQELLNPTLKQRVQRIGSRLKPLYTKKRFR